MSIPAHTHQQLRLAGVGALIAGLGFLPQPLLIFALPAPDGSEFFTPDRVGELAPRILVQALTWGVVASAALIHVVTFGRLSRGRWAAIGTTFGVIGAAAWLAESAWRLIPLSMPAEHLAQAPVDPGTQGAILYFLTLAEAGWTYLGAIGLGAWLLSLAGARQVLPGWLRVSAVIVGLLNLASVYLVPALPLGLALLYPFFLVMGGSLLIRVRRLQRAGVPSAAVPPR